MGILAKLKLSDYRDAFVQQKITYEAFLLLEERDLEKMQIPIGPCKLIMAEVLKLKAQEAQISK